ncbi:MAG: hemin uptake protein HemP [Ascidiaceihabitans sp.]|jgi:hemin uptake protein HemP
MVDRAAAHRRKVSAMSFHATPPKQAMTSTLPTYAAKDLTENGDLAQIVLDGQIYTLRITRAGKLILTK